MRYFAYLRSLGRTVDPHEYPSRQRGFHSPFPLCRLRTTSKLSPSQFMPNLKYLRFSHGSPTQFQQIFLFYTWSPPDFIPGKKLINIFLLRKEASGCEIRLSLHKGRVAA